MSAKKLLLRERSKREKARSFALTRSKLRKKVIAAREAKAAVGQQVELKLKDLFGAEQSLSQYKGRIVVLNFWATYCVPCREEMPDLAAIQNEYAALGVQVIGASTDEPQTAPKVLQFIKETKVNFPVWIGATAADMSRFGLGEALPGTVVIDKTGKIIKVISGIVNQRRSAKSRLTRCSKTAESNSAKESKQSPSRKTLEQEKSKASSVPS